MKISLQKQNKIFLAILFFAASIAGFMLKLPSSFRGYDKELHAAFYFIAAAFLNIVFTNKNIVWHLVIFGCLYLFGMGIEHAQAYSNKFFHVKIHGLYDREDVRYNLRGLIAFSILWTVYVAFAFFNKKADT